MVDVTIERKMETGLVTRFDSKIYKKCVNEDIK